MRLSAVRTTVAKRWRGLALPAGLLAGFAAVLWFRLGGLTGKYSPSELATFQHSSSLSSIYHAPLDAPYLLLTHGLLYFHRSLLATRIASAVAGVLALALFYALARYWHGERTAAWGTVLFGSSAWFLHTARLGSPDVMLFGMLALVACYAWIRKTASSWALLAGFFVVGLMLYVPCMIWFIAIGLVWQWRTIDRVFKKNLWAVTVGGLLLLAALTPLGLAIYHTPDIAKLFAGLPGGDWPQPLTVLKNLGEVPVHLFFKGQTNPEHWLDHIAVIDIFTMGMFFLGGYLYIRHLRLGRVQLTIAIFLLSAALISLGGLVSLTLLMPFVYLVAAAGIGFMLDRWLQVFPRNVIAQSTGYALLGLAVLATCWYSGTHYFVAWPQASATKALFVFTDAGVPSSDTIKE